MNKDKEALKMIYKMKADMITDHRDKVELHEWEIVKLFSYNPENLIDDEFTLNLIDRVYNRIHTKEMDLAIVENVKELLGEN